MVTCCSRVETLGMLGSVVCSYASWIRLIVAPGTWKKVVAERQTDDDPFFFLELHRRLRRIGQYVVFWLLGYLRRGGWVLIRACIH